MEQDSAFLAQALAGLFFTVAAVPLLRLARRTGMLPERTLGAVFLLMGISYGFYQAPLAFRSLEPWWTPLVFAGRLTYDASALAVALFMWRVTTTQRARRALVLTGLLLGTGVLVSGIEGDWEGMYPLSTWGYWIELMGQCIPFAWVAAWGLDHYRRAGRRMQLGMCDAIVRNRFLLWSLFGLMQLGSLVVLLPLNMEYEAEERISASMDALISVFEFLTIVTIWLAFFPPAAYRRWLDAPQPA